MPTYRIPHFLLTGSALHDEKPHAGRHALGGADQLALDGAQLTSGTVATARLGSGTAGGSTYMRGTSAWIARTVRGGVFPAMQSGRWYDSRFSLPLPAGGGFGFAPNFLSACPLFLPATVTIDALGINISSAGSAGSLYRLGIYAPRYDGRPGALLVDTGNLPLDVTGDRITAITPLVLGPGWIWLARNASATHSAGFLSGNSSPAVAFNGQTSLDVTTFAIDLSRAQTFGTLPLDFAASAATSGLIAARICLRVA